ncbi:MAG: hypothetical protein F6K22_05845 [Okeania sp. SIO2F4]|uniref:hypothetical protein n=1 Tax=Okeania sp. SIO2F4 TaxID=2607790 RepID=UPI00142AF756|nr:hypothetical protein [Okeania sp. SIO2F4]NES02403.1 hypothetical protein [Okeania sp. SIO2F4]
MLNIRLDETGILRVVVHTFKQINKSSYLIRIISAIQATFTEIQAYQKRQL